MPSLRLSGYLVWCRGQKSNGWSRSSAWAAAYATNFVPSRQSKWRENKMTKSILLVGVGGRGTILASKLLTIGLMESGYDVKMSEIHGMSQRGGSVSSQIRYGEKVYSPVIRAWRCGSDGFFWANGSLALVGVSSSGGKSLWTITASIQCRLFPQKQRIPMVFLRSSPPMFPHKNSGCRGPEAAKLEIPRLWISLCWGRPLSL